MEGEKLALALILWLLTACADGPGQLHYAECQRQADAKNYLLAIQACQQALDSEPEHVQARLLLGRLLLKHGRLDVASQHFEYIIQRDPQHLAAYEALGDLYVRQRRNDQAIAAYQKALQHAPDQPAFYRKLALVYGDQNRYADAVEVLHKALGARATTRGHPLQLGASLSAASPLRRGAGTATAGRPARFHERGRSLPVRADRGPVGSVLGSRGQPAGGVDLPSRSRIGSRRARACPAATRAVARSQNRAGASRSGRSV